MLAGALAAATWLLTGRALHPVETMRRQAADITATDLHRRVDVPLSADELSRLAITLNDLLTRLEAEESERLMRMEQDIQKRVISQSEAIKRISQAVRRSRSGGRRRRCPSEYFCPPRR